VVPERPLDRRPIITTGEQAVSHSISTFHRKTMDLARDAIDRFPRSDRDISTLTLGLSEDGRAKAREEIRRCRRKLLEIAKQDERSDRVYQFNFQAFPVSVMRKNS